MDAMEYAGTYQAIRRTRCKSYGATFLPLEALRHKQADRLYLSVSFSGTGSGDTYFTQNADLYRAVQIRFRWFVIPTTISTVLTRQEFVDHFGDFLVTEEVDGEEFWVLRKAYDKELRSRIAALDLSNDFRHEYAHAYLPDSEQELADGERQKTDPLPKS